MRRHRGARPRSGRAAPYAALVVCAVLVLAGCGQQTTSGLAADAAGRASSVQGGQEDTSSSEVVRLERGAERPRLACPTGARSMMIADFAVGAKGAPTPQDAVGLDSLAPGEHMVVSPSGSWVWLVGPDGTVRQQVHLTHLRGWFLHTRVSCA